ncbi:MAG TPA: HNH endonuclease signature motif containing protein [Pirellulales bacterium]|nr:HNH endonuclease signature motif containing protein [Pirellulales bacterium]
MTNNTSAAIVNLLIDPERDDLRLDAARFLGDLDFPPSDHARMGELSKKAAEGALSPDGREELGEYFRVADLLAVIQAKARRAAFCCEYCKLPQSAYRFRFPVDHIIARQHFGETTFGNLGLASLLNYPLTFGPAVPGPATGTTV